MLRAVPKVHLEITEINNVINKQSMFDSGAVNADILDWTGQCQVFNMC